jgi:hypothetical protein
MLTIWPIHEKRRPWGFVLLLFLASLIFCAAPAPAVGAAELKAELVNKIAEEMTGDGGFYTGQVKLIFPDGHTQLLPYRPHLQPLVAKGKVHIFVTEVGKVNSIVIYDPAKGWGQSFLLPNDLPHSPCGNVPIKPSGLGPADNTRGKCWWRGSFPGPRRAGPPEQSGPKASFKGGSPKSGG